MEFNSQGHGGTDAGTGARNQGGFAFEVFHVNASKCATHQLTGVLWIGCKKGRSVNRAQSDCLGFT